MKDKINKILALILSLALVVSSIVISEGAAKADEKSWKINPVEITTLTTNDGKVFYGIANLSFTAYQGSAASDYAYAAFIDDISDDHLARSSSNDWVWGIGDGGNNLNYDKVVSTNAKDITFAPGSTHKFIIAVYEKGTANDVTKATPLDTVELVVTFPTDEIVITTPKPAEAGTTKNVEQGNVNIDAITDWVVIGDNLSATNTKSYMSSATRTQVNANNGALNGFYNGVTAPWGKKNQIVNYFAFVVPNGKVATSITIDGVRYSNDNYNTYIEGDCVFINQELLALPEGVEKKAFTITLDGTDLPTFALLVAKDGTQIGTTTTQAPTTTAPVSTTTTKPVPTTTTTPLPTTEKATEAPSKEQPTTAQPKKSIKLSINNGGKNSVITIEDKDSVSLCQNHKEFIKEYPNMINQGYVFAGWYKDGKKITTVNADANISLKWRALKTRFKNLKTAKGKVKLYFNNVDWANIDGMKITYSRNEKFKKKKNITVNTNGKKLKRYIVTKSNKKFKAGAVYFFKVKFFYKVGNKKVYYKGSNSYKWLRYYKK